MGMFCYQCEQSAKGAGCTVKGVCGKEETTSALQDLLLYTAKGIAAYASRAGKMGARDNEVDVFTAEAVFSTLTNVNFDDTRIKGLIDRAATMRDRARGLYEDACKKAGQTPETLTGAATFTPGIRHGRAACAGRRRIHNEASGKAGRGRRGPSGASCLRH